jgi:hypothetical protein
MTEEPHVFRVGKLGVQEEVGEFVGRLCAKAVGFTLLVIVAGVVMFFRDGLAIRATVLVVGGVLSLAGLIGFNRTVIQQAATGEAKCGWAPMFKVFGGFLPYLFSCYLFFFEGAWQIIRLFKSFSWLRLVAALVFLVAGHALVTACYRVSEFARGLSEGRIVIQEEEEE